MVVRISDKKKNYGKITKLLVKPKIIDIKMLSKLLNSNTTLI